MILQIQMSQILNSTEQTYTFEYNKNNISITLQKESAQTVTMDVGFYPKVITDFNYFYNGYDFYSGYTDTEIQESINKHMIYITHKINIHL